MAVLFGEGPDSEGWVKASVIQHKMDNHENGYVVNNDDIPEYPEGGKGVGWVQYYHPKQNKWKFEPVKVPFTKEESMLEIAAAIRELAQAIKEK